MWRRAMCAGDMRRADDVKGTPDDASRRSSDDMSVKDMKRTIAQQRLQIEKLERELAFIRSQQ
jgi:hypothetical protein